MSIQKLRKFLETSIVSLSFLKKGLSNGIPGWPDEFVKKLCKMKPNPYFVE
jgi:hypothetical protein